jgi:hypothetical protein
VETFVAYRKSALRRQEIRRELTIDTAEKLTALTLRQEQVLRMYDRTVHCNQKQTKSGSRSELRGHHTTDHLAATGS